MFCGHPLKTPDRKPENESTRIIPIKKGLIRKRTLLLSDSEDRFQAELPEGRESCLKPESNAFFCIGEDPQDAFCQPVIAEMNPFFYGRRFLQDGDF